MLVILEVDISSDSLFSINSLESDKCGVVLGLHVEESAIDNTLKSFFLEIEFFVLHICRTS